MKILVADAFPKERLADLEKLGLAVDHRPDVSAKDLPAAVRDASVLVVRSKQVTAEVFEAAQALSLVVRAGAGVNTIDVAAASRRGVFVANCPGQNSIAVAELAIGLVLSLDRRIPDQVTALRAGHWDKKGFSEARGVFGRTLAVAGCGSIGREVIRRAQALGMRVVAWSRSLDDAGAKALGVERAPDLHALAREADFLSLHLALSSQTRGVVSRAVLEALPPGAALVNTARAELVDQDALLELARSGRLRVGTDVFAGEPEKGKADFRSELAALPGVYGTHHVGASTEQAQDAIARETIRIVEVFVRSGHVPNCVNVARKTPARARLVVRHYDKVGVLANVLGLIREAGINVEAVQNTIFDQAQAASCAIELDEAPPAALVERIRARSDEVLFVDAFCLGERGISEKVDGTTPFFASNGGETPATKRAFVYAEVARRPCMPEGAMHGRAVVLHPALMRTPWHVAFAIATADVAKHLTLTLAVMAGGAIAATLVLLLTVVSAPLGLALLTWLLWRASRDGARGVKRSFARARRRARALGLRVVQGAGGT